MRIEEEDGEREEQDEENEEQHRLVLNLSEDVAQLQQQEDHPDDACQTAAATLKSLPQAEVCQRPQAGPPP